MQLFGLVNTMLANDRATAERDLSIARYAGGGRPRAPLATPCAMAPTHSCHLELLLRPRRIPPHSHTQHTYTYTYTNTYTHAHTHTFPAVIPLSPNSGLIGWVPNCDTLHALIREFR